MTADWDAVLAKFRQSTVALALELPRAVYEQVAVIHKRVDDALLSAALRERESAKEVERLLARAESAERALEEARKDVREYMECDRLMRTDGCPDERYQPALLAMEKFAAIDPAIEAEKRG